MSAICRFFTLYKTRAAVQIFMECNIAKQVILATKLNVWLRVNQTEDTTFEVFKVVLLNIEIFWEVTPCRLINSYRRFE
jgi:hypothetical protein